LARESDIRNLLNSLDSGFRGNDEKRLFLVFYATINRGAYKNLAWRMVWSNVVQRQKNTPRLSGRERAFLEKFRMHPLTLSI